MRVRIEHGLREEVIPRPVLEVGIFTKLIRLIVGQPPPRPPIIEEHYHVELYLDLSEEEKHTIELFNLGPTVIEEFQSTIKEERIEQIIKDRLKREADFRMRKLDASEEREIERVTREILTAPVPFTVEMLMEANPYVRRVEGKGEALKFIHHLKTSTLPKFKEIIEEHKAASQPSSESFEL